VRNLLRVGEDGKLGIFDSALIVFRCHAWLVKWMPAVAEQVHDDGARPHIHCLRVGVVAKYFRSHIEHSPALASRSLRVMEVQLCAQSEVSDL
jgi:hypothetical protein